MNSKLRVLLVQLPVPNNPGLNTPLADRAGDALLVETIVARQPDMLGLSLYTWNSERSLDIARWVKAGCRRGVGILLCCLPSKRPWLNPIEPKWMHGKRAVVEPDRRLTAQELADRVCAYYGCQHESHLVQSQKAA